MIHKKCHHNITDFDITGEILVSVNLTRNQKCTKISNDFSKHKDTFTNGCNQPED